MATDRQRLQDAAEIPIPRPRNPIPENLVLQLHLEDVVVVVGCWNGSVLLLLLGGGAKQGAQPSQTSLAASRSASQAASVATCP